MKLSVIGLGKLGACTAACFASKGFDVIGVDINLDFVSAINQGNAPVDEPQLQHLIQQSQSRFKATTDYSLAIIETAITFLIVPTPSRLDGHFSDDYLQMALKPLSEALRNKSEFHTFVITSTVSPGTIEEILIPFIEHHAQKKLNIGFGIAYNPEFIALGSVIKDFLNPDLVLIGESHPKVGDQLEAIYQKVVETKPYIARMSIVSAEIAKISLNSYITMKISFANTLAGVCQQIPNAKIDDITAALGADKRISPHYLKGGLGFGGPCFPRDNRAFSAFTDKYNIDAKLSKATDGINYDHTERLYQYLSALCKTQKAKKIALLGLSYKSKTAVIEESPAIKLIQHLLKENLSIVVYDPLAMNAVKELFSHSIEYADSMQDCFIKASICIFMTIDEAWSSIESCHFIHESTTIVDCWRIFNASQFDKSISYIRLGEYHTDSLNKNHIVDKESAA